MNHTAQVVLRDCIAFHQIVSPVLADLDRKHERGEELMSKELAFALAVWSYAGSALRDP